MPGKLLANLRGVSRVCGGTTPGTAQAMMALYHHVVDADLDSADCLTAELVKTAENAYRDVNIAFANEVALGGDVWKVRELVNKSPGRNMLLPEGHIHYSPFTIRLIPAARAVNDGMPLHMVDLTVEALQKAGVDIAEARVAVLGYAYLENSDDTRNSPTKVFVERLRELGAEVSIHDSMIKEYQGDLKKTMQGSDAVVLAVAHDAYSDLDLCNLRFGANKLVLIDGRCVFSEKQLPADCGYWLIGRG
jgi:UDP-N-acetyl-D-mannosaminuronic acid dehydrogenase